MIHIPPLPSKTTILGLLQIRILHLRKRREKSFATLKKFLVLKLRRFKVVNLPFTDLVIFEVEKKSFIIGDRALIFGHSR